MGKKKKPQKHGWAKAIQLCRLNRHEVEMAKKLGFDPDSLIRNRPDPKQKWKAPVKYWVRDLYRKRFGCVIGPDEWAIPEAVPAPIDQEIDDEAARIFGEQLYWEDYWDRNSDDPPGKKGKSKTANPSTPSKAPGQISDYLEIDDPPYTGGGEPPISDCTDDDVPF